MGNEVNVLSEQEQLKTRIEFLEARCERLDKELKAAAKAVSSSERERYLKVIEKLTALAESEGGCCR